MWIYLQNNLYICLIKNKNDNNNNDNFPQADVNTDI